MLGRSVRGLLLTGSKVSEGSLEALTRSGLQTEVVNSVDDLMDRAVTSKPDVVLLDHRLCADRLSAICLDLRSMDRTRHVSTVVFSCRKTAGARLRALEAGADHSISGGMDGREFHLTVQAAARRIDRVQGPRILAFSDLELDVERYMVSRGGRTVPLPTLQFRLLRRFLEEPTVVLSYEKLLEDVWAGRPLDRDAVKAAIIRLRRALAANGGKELIRTVHGVGYALDSECLKAAN